MSPNPAKLRHREKTVLNYFEMTVLVKLQKKLKSRPIEHQLKIFLFEFEFHNLLLVSGATLTSPLLSFFLLLLLHHSRPIFLHKTSQTSRDAHLYRV